ncbi:hypothetical protein HYDPIDRAFT_120461 [Hydnomerulius pinastri MD-312]|uniref:Uncharacterized protein n=1 Tax=Hydnomerulius pinastri MD-312 TaxID=994086 RepID=A0A0C9VWS8_9AGAM|nr:hypothetical protein HYDPIDRAFT_120461 [Hydnomerulius pinastri MD-312]
MSMFKAPMLGVGIRAKPVRRQNPCVRVATHPVEARLYHILRNKTSRYVWEWTYLRYQRCGGRIAGIDTRQRADRR